MTDLWPTCQPYLDAIGVACACLEATLRDGVPEPSVPYIDRTDEMPVNSHPTHSDFVRCFPGRDMWPLRNLSDITGITIHHSMSHSPLATARYCTAGKGYPTIQYHYWVSASDGCECYMLVDPAVALWHDHTGAHPRTLSVALAGRWDHHTPPGEQLQAVAELCVWLMHQYAIPTGEVKGHTDRAGRNKYGKPITVCPGWYSGVWHDTFFKILADTMGD